MRDRDPGIRPTPCVREPEQARRGDRLDPGEPRRGRGALAQPDRQKSLLFLRKLGVTYPQYLVLVVLWERGPLGVGDLASALRIDFGTLSPMLKRIESKGLVTRRRKPTDERRVLVDLTPKGVSLRKRTEQMLGEFYCFLNIPLDELVDLKDRLHNFVNFAGPKELRMTPTKILERVS